MSRRTKLTLSSKTLWLWLWPESKPLAGRIWKLSGSVSTHDIMFATLNSVWIWSGKTNHLYILSLCFSVRCSLVWCQTQKERIVNKWRNISLVVGSPLSPWCSSAHPRSWAWPWPYTLMTLTAATGVPETWSLRTPCSSRWPCTPTTLLLQTYSYRWSHAGPLRAMIHRIQSKVYFCRMGRWKCDSDRLTHVIKFMNTIFMYHI